MQAPQTPAQRPPGPLHIPSLDGIRAISFLTVFLAHAGLGAWVPGYFGLTLFFFLSGYLITTLLRLEFDRGSDVSLSQFYLRRVLRIFPPFYLVLFAAGGLTMAGVFGEVTHWTAFPAQALHVTNYYIVRHGWWEGIPPGTWVYWSLAVEEHFYLVFPLVYLLLRRRGLSGRQQAAVLASLCAAVLAWRFVLVFALHASKDRTYVASDTRVDSILFGCILAVWHNPVLDKDVVDDRRLARLWLPLGLVALAASLLIRKPWFEQTLRYTLQGLGLFPLFIAAIRWPDRGIFKALSFRWVQHLGVLSYSLYLLHTPTIWAFELWTHWPAAVRGVASLAAALILAEIIYRLVELPAARVRKRLSGYLRA